MYEFPLSISRMYVTSHIHSWNAVQKLFQLLRQEEFSLLTAANSIESQWKKWIDKWMEGEEAILIMFYGLAIVLTGEATARTCHSCFCLQILHHDAHVQGNNQSINKKQKQTKGSKWCIAPTLQLHFWKQKQWQPNRCERAHMDRTFEGDWRGVSAKHNPVLSWFVGFPPWNDCFTQINTLNISCILGVDRNKSLKSFFFNEAIS